MIITRAHVNTQDESTNSRPGDIEFDVKPGILAVSCGVGLLSIDEIKPSGKKKYGRKIVPSRLQF